MSGRVRLSLGLCALRGARRRLPLGRGLFEESGPADTWLYRHLAESLVSPPDQTDARRDWFVHAESSRVGQSGWLSWTLSGCKTTQMVRREHRTVHANSV